MGDPTARLLDLDARHCELLDRLAELDERVNEVLCDWNRSKETLLEEQQKRNLFFDNEMKVSNAEKEVMEEQLSESETQGTEPE